MMILCMIFIAVSVVCLSLAIYEIEQKIEVLEMETELNVRRCRYYHKQERKENNHDYE